MAGVDSALTLLFFFLQAVVGTVRTHVQLARAMEGLTDACSTQATRIADLEQNVKQLQGKVADLEALCTGRQQPVLLADSVEMLQTQVGLQ
jgi:hypothetical protein